VRGIAVENDLMATFGPAIKFHLIFPNCFGNHRSLTPGFIRQSIELETRPDGIFVKIIRE
jgi:hypothetical protein